MARPNMEQRAYSFEIRADEKQDDGIVVLTGRPIVYGSKTDLGDFDEVIEKGALDGANLKDVRFLINHDVSMVPLARSRNNNENSTMQLMPNDEGLDIRVNIDTANNDDARKLASAIERGDISGMSFMFAVGEDSWDDLKSEHPTRTIMKIADVLEVSAVTFPAYEDTTIGVRSEAKAALENARAALVSAESSLDNELELVKAKIKLIGEI